MGKSGDVNPLFTCEEGVAGVTGVTGEATVENLIDGRPFFTTGEVPTLI